MQTFLPYDSFASSLRILDTSRLGKQRLEARQILMTLRGESNGWAHHPAVKMWKGYENALIQYMNESILQWEHRGFKNTMWMESINGTVELPHWFGMSVFHTSHKSNLLRKNPKHYGQFGWEVPLGLPYFWPKGKED
jgi:hypothetical protein